MCGEKMKNKKMWKGVKLRSPGSRVEDRRYCAETVLYCRDGIAETVLQRHHTFGQLEVGTDRAWFCRNATDP